MDTEGTLAPETAAAAREAYEELGPAAQVTTREAAKAMEFDREEYRERVTSDVVGTVRDALFASLLRVHVGTREEFDGWLADHPDYEADVAGSDNVDRVVWHPVPFAGAGDVDGAEAGTDGAVGASEANETPGGGLVVAATYQDERDAAVGTLRRRAFGAVYRERLGVDDAGASAGADADAADGAGRADGAGDADESDGSGGPDRPGES
ncbi:DUF5809 family protein [Candidatus Halobonum tyrrellensis]|uniref:Uncharacterized protein n=1 Tax=Candidatus Halobonum tyrrellensis G22 TaxID=1324957 RepID=V4IVT3_9EURY|nr:DUF5809 family protein [Candidatus Halobonum tyrrellensis]ESP87292.1 hypothetical protein K933_14438 [Candidatus Halobonum tyrrellensis G22]